MKVNGIPLKEEEDHRHQPWRGAYRAVMVKCPVLLERMLTILFPQQSNYTIAVEKEQLIVTCGKVGAKKALGLNEIPNVAFRTAIKARPEWFVSTFNTCLEKDIFATEKGKSWLPKCGKPPGLFTGQYANVAGVHYMQQTAPNSRRSRRHVHTTIRFSRWPINDGCYQRSGLPGRGSNCRYKVVRR